MILEAFRKCQSVLSSSGVLVHYDNKRSMKLACNVSSYGLGAVLSHFLLMKNAVAIARTLNKAEHNYSQIEKKALALIFGVKSINTFLDIGLHLQITNLYCQY